MPAPESGKLDRVTVAILDVASGAITPLNDATHLQNNAVFSPDGRSIAYWAPAEGHDTWTENAEVHVAPVGGGPGRSVTHAIDRNIYAAHWMPDGTALVVAGNDRTGVGMLPGHVQLLSAYTGRISGGACVMAWTRMLGRREFLGATLGSIGGAALVDGKAHAAGRTRRAAPTPSRNTAPWVVSDVARLRRVIISPPDHDQGLDLEGGRLDLEPWVDREDWLRDHAMMRALLETNGAEVLTFERVLDEAIANGRAKGQFRTWLRATVPPLSSEEREMTAARLMGAARQRLYPSDEDGNYRHLVNGDTLTWPRDAAVMLPTGLLICNFVSEGRAFSAHLMRFAAEYAPSLARYPVVFDAIEEQVLVEGGDVQVHDGKTLVVGFGNRTEPGAPRRLAQRLNMDVVAVQMRKGEYLKRPAKESPLNLSTTFLHLDTCCTLVDLKHVVVLPWFFEQAAVGKDPFTRLLKGLARHPRIKEEEAQSALSWLVEMGKVTKYAAGSGEVDREVTGMKLVDYLRMRGYRVTYVGGTPPADADIDYLFDVVWREHMFQAANVVATQPGHVVSYDHCPRTHEALRAAGIEVETFPGANLRRGYGGPHCLTLPLERG